MKKYVLTIQRDYCSDWTVPDALRELLQNSLDSSSPFVYEIGDDYVEFTNKGVSLAANTLLLGLTSKRNDSSSVGGKGEGYKIALLILTREGVDVEILNGNRKWVPSIEWDHNYEAEMLHITETDLSGNSDLTFRVNGLSSQDIETTVENCLYLQDGNLLGNYATASCGSRVFFERSGKLYVGGLFVCNTDLKYVYDMHPSKLPLNRDRKQVTDWDLQGSTSKVLQEVLDSTKIVELAKEDVPDVQHLQYSWSRISSEAKELVFYEVCGRKYQDTLTLEQLLEHVQGIYKEYGDRARQAKENVGVDFKAVHHALRASYQMLGILKDGDFEYPLPQTEFLLAVKKGELNFVKEVQPELDNLIVTIEKMSEESSLPHKVDREYWDNWLLGVYNNYL